MRYFIILLLCCFLEQVTGRPQAVTQDYKDADVSEYESEDAAPGGSHRRYEGAAADDKVSNKEEEEVMESHPNRNYFFKHHGAGRSQDDQTTKENTEDKFSDFKTGRKIEGPEDETADNDQYHPVTNGKYDRYNEPNNANNHFNQGVETQRDNGVIHNPQLIKLRESDEQDESSDVVYDNNGSQEENANNNKKRNYDTAASIGQPHFYSHYYNRQPTDNKESEDDDPYEEISQEEANRGRRDTNDPDESNNGNTHDTKEKKDFDSFENEAEQAIIQRYVKKLNKKEVEDLMRTLSDDKRAILEQIIDSDGTNQGIYLRKREITKKAEAVEDNSFMDGVQSDSSKISGPLISFDMGSGVTKDDNPTGVTPTVEENVSSVNNDDNRINRRSTDANKENVSDKIEHVAVTSTSTESMISKSENKREANVNEFRNDRSPDNVLTNEHQEASIVGLQDGPYSGTKDDELGQLFDEDSQLHYDYRSPQKRDIMVEDNADLAEPMKSLQESFSDSNNYDNAGYFGDSNMMPLIRVKRRNNEHAVKKRAAAVLPESKVAYVPENEDEDNDEGNEIYDDGFFDRTANFAKSNSRGDKVSDTRERAYKLNAVGNQSVFKRSSAEGIDARDGAKNTLGIGSDTDSVLSGVEGVDENLMYTGGCRKKRAVEKNTKLEPVGERIKADIVPNVSRSSLVGDIGRPEILGVSFSSNDNFGPASKGYDGELGRFKRIRRLKPQMAVKGSSPSTEESVVQQALYDNTSL